MHARTTLVTMIGALLLIPHAVSGQDLAAQSLPLGGGSGGTVFSRTCPSGSVLTGVRARVGAVVDAIGIKCRPVRSDGTLGGENDVGPLAGGTGGSLTNGSCPQGSVIFGQLVTAVVGVVGYLRLVCHAWTAGTRTVGGRTLDIHVLTPTGMPLVSGSTNCSNRTQPARGIRGRADAVVDAFGLTCNEP